MNVSLNCPNGLKAFEIVHQGVPAHDCLAFKGEEDFLKKKSGEATAKLRGRLILKCGREEGRNNAVRHPRG